ncbi:hypothetical protein Glove_294g148 [Diversispora epigaea]|uniref:BTB domain-containing protein n=1 Tax=Diversispora epigaea TaxID=1348612 RepID=A0A397HZH9_9GLOM|nr:hypothetical protein Glove_294g148 [Diversispora epigaea]
MAFKFFDKLSQNFIELLNDKDDYNVIIKIKNEKSFTAHSNVLKCRSPYFRKELENVTSNKNNIKTINKRNISDQIFDSILKYIYGGIIKLENAETIFIFDLMMAAGEFELEELTEKLEILLIETKSSWLKSHFSQVYRSIFSKNNFKALENFFNDIITKHPSLIFDADDFNSLQESALVSLLKQDNLQLEEVKIWEYTIKWGIAQNPALPTNLEEWTNENFTALKTSLQQCLPYIRYFQISGADIWNKLKPYKKILDKQLWNDLKQYLVVPDQQVKSKVLPPRTALVQKLPVRITEPPKLFSAIITYEHAAEISTWIDHKSSIYSLFNTPYQFELILRGSRDGFTIRTFWDKCHGHFDTVIIIKVEGTNEILGGYNPLSWRKEWWGKTKNSFIFSLKNGNVRNSILSRVKDSQYAIWSQNITNRFSLIQDSNLGFGHNDLRMGPDRGNIFEHVDFTDNVCYCAKSDYEIPIRTTTDKFSIEDYEVFKVIKTS